jgi:hypothetical protein
MIDIFDVPGPNIAAAMDLYKHQFGRDPKRDGWAKFRGEMYRLANRFPREDVTPEEAAHVWLEALGKDVPDPTCGRGGSQSGKPGGMP